MKKMRTLVTALCAFALTHAAMADVEVGEKAPEFTLPSAAGQEVSLEQYRGKYVVLEWINYGCPFVKKFYDGSSKMAELQNKWKGKDVVWLSICSSAPGKQGYYTAAEAMKTNDQKGWSGSHYLIDDSGKVGKEYDATNTPQMFVIDPAGEIIYMGAIDSTKSANAGDIEKST
ncbi:MAG: redoxin domain-containing protein [Puniceicoccales bacterium]